jgi:hypothetical protein
MDTWDGQGWDEPGGRRRPATLAAVAVAMLVLAAAGAVALLGGGSGPSAASGHPPAPVPAADVDTVDAVDSTVPRGPASAAGPEPLLTAPEVSWELVNGVAVPVSATAGPTVAAGPVRRGFERSQAGGLLAAAQISIRSTVTPGEGWRAVVEEQVLPGTGRDVFTRLRARVEADDPAGTYGQLAGFRIVAFTPDVTVVQLVTRYGAGAARQLQVLALTVKWVDGDWRLELQPDGGASPTAQLVPDLDGFVVWGGA